MDLNVKEPGWEKFEWEGVTCEIRRLSEGEDLALRSKLLGLDGVNLFSSEVQAIIDNGGHPYIRGIKGLKINGKPLKEFKDLMDPGTGAHPKLAELYAALVGRFLALREPTEEEAKNSTAPPADPGK